MRQRNRRDELDKLAKAKGWMGFSSYCTALLHGEVELPRNLSTPAETMQALGVQGKLTRRESQVLARIILGLSDKEIAAQLRNSDRTVRHQVSSLLTKLGARDRKEIIVRYSQLSLGDGNSITRRNFMEILERVSRPVSRKELEVLKMASEGMSSDEIGLVLGKNKKTVETQLAAGLKKMGIERKQLESIPVKAPESEPKCVPGETPAPKPGYCRGCLIIRLSQSDQNGLCAECAEEFRDATTTHPS